jgi:rhamnosyltransferase
MVEANASAAPGLPLCAVVVAYHPDPDVVENLHALVRECGRVLVVDNGSNTDAQTAMTAVPGVTLLPQGRNLGLAVALNLGLDRAGELGFTWAVTFDQDSRPEPGFVQALWAMHLAHPAAAVVAPRIREIGGVDENHYRWLRPRHRPPFFALECCHVPGLAAVTIAVTSGSLMELVEWRRLGRFEAGFFIDYIDIDYCLRVVRAGRRVAVAHDAVLAHRLGARRKRVLFGRDFRPMHHAPFRHYYMARNRIIVWRRHALAVPHWVAFDLSFAVYNYTRVLLFEDQRWAKFKAIVRGTWHGLMGKKGEMPP